MLLNSTLSNVLYYVIQYLAYTPFISILTNTYTESKKCIFFAFFSALFLSFGALFNPNYVFTNIFNVAIIFLFSVLFFDIDEHIGILFTTICSIISFLTNIFCFSANVFIFSSNYNLYHSIIFLIVLFGFYNFLRNHDLNKFINYLRNTPNIYFLILALIFSYNFTIYADFTKIYLTFFIQLTSTLILINHIKISCEKNNMQLMFSNFILKYNKLKSLNDEIRIFKHDYNNTLCSIGGYIALNDMNGLKKFYNKLTYDINKTNTSQMLNTSIINEPSIYNLLISKHNNIVQKNLNFNFYSAINYKELPVSAYDFSKILGILLDNAIDAAYTSPEKELSLICEINKNNNYQITIKNSYINKDVEIDKIFLKGYSSKAVKSGLRIMGSFKNNKIST